MCVCVSAFVVAKWVGVCRKVSVCGQRVVRHGVSEVHQIKKQ